MSHSNYHKIFNQPLIRFSKVSQISDLDQLKKAKEKTGVSVIDFSSYLKAIKDHSKNESFSRGRVLKNYMSNRNNSTGNKSFIIPSTQKNSEYRVTVRKISAKKGGNKRYLNTYFVPRENIPIEILKNRANIL